MPMRKIWHRNLPDQEAFAHIVDHLTKENAHSAWHRDWQLLLDCYGYSQQLFSLIQKQTKHGKRFRLGRRPSLRLSRQGGSAWLKRQLRSMRGSKGHLGESHPMMVKGGRSSPSARFFGHRPQGGWGREVKTGKEELDEKYTVVGR